eukprot:NODE_86_length_22163_cov_0.379442.p11 type:complete len:200 gc:universal NODE_86_length_22163_cov_0.379442:20343-20942(+)
MKLPIFKTLPNVYDPSEDSFLLMDALEILKDINPVVVVEVCCGTGTVGTFAKYLFPNSHIILSDKFIDPCVNAKNTLLRNNLLADVVQMNLADNFRFGTIDLLICNPPYVPSESELSGIDAAWAGGLYGCTAVTVPLLLQINRILSSQGQLLLLLLKVNLKYDLLRLCNENNLSFSCVIERQCGREFLFVFSIKKLNIA